MPAETTEKQDANRDAGGARPTGEAASIEEVKKASGVIPPSGRRPARKRLLVIGVLGALVVAAVCVWGIPWILLSLDTVSTDDAYVNGHVTFVAPRVAGQISRVLVDDNYRVR